MALQAREFRSTAKNVQNKRYVDGLVESWKDQLVGVKDPHKRKVLAMLFESQADHLENLDEETITANIGAYQKYIFPWLRRIFPNLIANELVSVQPAMGPRQTVFTFEWKYGNTKGSISKGQNLIETFGQNYSSEYIDFEIWAPANSLPDTNQTAITNAVNANVRSPAQWLPVQPLKTGIGTPTTKLVTVTFTTAANSVCTATDDGTGKLNLASGTVTGKAVGDQIGTINYTSGVWQLDLAGGGSHFKQAAAVTATYWYVQEKVAFTPNGRNPSVYMDIVTDTVEVQTRRLTTMWSQEAIEDLRNQHGQEGEQVLMEGMANQIQLEIDREIIGDLTHEAAFSGTHDLAGGTGWGMDHTNGMFKMTELDVIRSIMTSVDGIGARIHKGSGRAPANWMVLGPTMGALLRQLVSTGLFVENKPVIDTPDSYSDTEADFGIMEIGRVGGKYRVFQDPLFDETKILIGLKGRSYMHAGYVFMPYIGISATNNLEDPDTFTVRKGMRTRYGKKMLRPKFYGVLTVTGTPIIADA